MERNKFDKNLDNTIKGKKTSAFYTMIGQIIPGCATKMNIGIIIKGDDLIVLLKHKSIFKPIESDQVSNIFCLISD